MPIATPRGLDGRAIPGSGKVLPSGKELHMQLVRRVMRLPGKLGSRGAKVGSGP